MRTKLVIYFRIYLTFTNFVCEKHSFTCFRNRRNKLNNNYMKKIFTLLAVAFATIGASAQTLPSLADIIKTQPEGTLHKDLNHYFEGAYVNKSDGFIYDHLGDGHV